jgi:rubrerythrin
MTRNREQLLRRSERPVVDVLDMEFAPTYEEEDRERTGRWRCIGCGRFLRSDGDWNQCPDCDTRTPEDY